MYNNRQQQFYPSNYKFRNRENISTFVISSDDIVKTIWALDPNMAHGHDEISIRMIKICASSISKPLAILFWNCFESECFPKNYRPVSLLPICSKIFEKVIFNLLFKYLDDNNLLTRNQSGFRPGHSCVHQLLSITHKIYKSFDANPSWIYQNPLIGFDMMV